MEPLDSASLYGTKRKGHTYALVPLFPDDSDGATSDSDSAPGGVSQPDENEIRFDDLGSSERPARKSATACETATSPAQVRKNKSSQRELNGKRDAPRKKSREENSTLVTVPLQDGDQLKDDIEGIAKRQRIWKKTDIINFEVPAPVFTEPEAVRTLYEHFNSMLMDDIAVHICHHTNLYSTLQMGHLVDATPAEFGSYLGILTFM